MNVKFDNLKYYLEVKKELLDDLTAEQKSNMRYYGWYGYEYSSRDFTLSQVLYAHYMPYFDINFLVKHAELLPKNEIDIFYHVIEVMKIFKEQLIEELDELCSDINYDREDAKIIEKALPLCPHLLKHFLLNYDYKNRTEIDLTNHLAILITTDFYCSLVTDDFEHFQECMDEMSFALKKYTRIKNVYKVLRDIKQLLKKWSKQLGFEDSMEPSNDIQHPVLDGDFVLSWQYVTFINGFIYFFHPFHPNENPYKLRHIDSISAFNDIKKYFSGRLPHILVNAKMGRIQKVYNAEDIDLCVEKLVEKYYKSHQSINPKIDISTMNDEQIRNHIRQQKSKYLNWLCDHQIKGYKIYYVREIQTNSNLIDNDEDAFVFSILENDATITLVYENTKDSRSSLVFRVPISCFLGTIHDIHMYFSSNAVNKREMIAKNIVKDELFKRFSFKRILHQNLEQWTTEIIYF